MLPVETVHVVNNHEGIAQEAKPRSTCGLGFTHVGWGLLVLAEMVFKGPTPFCWLTLAQEHTGRRVSCEGSVSLIYPLFEKKKEAIALRCLSVCMLCARERRDV